MKSFLYEARDNSSGKILKSKIKADSEKIAAEILLKRNLTPVKIKEHNTNNPLRKLFYKIRSKDRVVFLRQLSTLIGAGLPLTQSLRTVYEQTSNSNLKLIIEDVVVGVEGGSSLADAFKKHPDVFDKMVVALIAAGEASGTLDESLKRIASQKEKDAAIISRIRGAMVYPAIVLLVIIGVLIFMLLTIIPEVERLYADMNKPLPMLTQAMIAISDFIVNYWWIVILLVFVKSYFLRRYAKTERGSRVIGKIKLSMPLFRGMFKKLYMARFARTGQILLTSGVPMLEALRISSEGINNIVVSDSIDEASKKVKSGKTLSDSLTKQKYVLELLPQMISIGEQSGSIDEMLGKTAQIYEDELDLEIKSLSTTIEPILMVIMAILVGGMVGAVLFPIYGLVQGIQ